MIIFSDSRNPMIIFSDSRDPKNTLKTPTNHYFYLDFRAGTHTSSF